MSSFPGKTQHFIETPSIGKKFNSGGRRLLTKNKRLVDTDRLDIPFFARMIEYGQKRVSVLL
jgi:hypothetical protein